MKFRLISLLLILANTSLFSGAVLAQSRPAENSKPATTATARKPSTSVSDSTKALEVRGQSRNLSMMLVLKNRKNSIDFVKPREHYSEEIKNTGF